MAPTKFKLDGSSGDLGHVCASLEANPELAEFWQQCFEALVSLDDEEDIWSDYVAGPPRTLAKPAPLTLRSESLSVPEFQFARAPARVELSTRRTHATSGRGAADEDYS